MYKSQSLLRRFLAVSLITSLAFSACGHTYYAVEYLFYRKNTYLPDEQGDLSKAQLDALLNASTITFARGSQCNDIRVGEERRVSGVDLISTDCGALMSELEAAAHASGFRVISSKSIQEPLHQNASKQGVDLIIDVNRLSIDMQIADSLTVGEVRFYLDNEDAVLTRLLIPNKEEVAELCMEKRAPQLKPSIRPTGILDVKVSDAKHGALLTREVVAYPEGSTAVASAKQYYYGDTSQTPDTVICRNDPSDDPPDWHRRPEPKPRKNTSDRGSSVTFVGDSQVPRDDVIRIIRGTAQKFVERLTLLRAAHSRQGEWEKKQWGVSAADTTTLRADRKGSPRRPGANTDSPRLNKESGGSNGNEKYLSNIIENIYKISQESVDINDGKRKLTRVEGLYNSSKNDPIAGYYYGIMLRKYPGDAGRCSKVQQLLATAMQYCTELAGKKRVSDSQNIQCSKTIMSEGEHLMKDCPPGKLEQ